MFLDVTVLKLFLKYLILKLMQLTLLIIQMLRIYRQITTIQLIIRHIVKLKRMILIRINRKFLWQLVIKMMVFLLSLKPFQSLSLNWNFPEWINICINYIKHLIIKQLNYLKILSILINNNPSKLYLLLMYKCSNNWTSRL